MFVILLILFQVCTVQSDCECRPETRVIETGRRRGDNGENYMEGGFKIPIIVKVGEDWTVFLTFSTPVLEVDCRGTEETSWCSDDYQSDFPAGPGCPYFKLENDAGSKSAEELSPGDYLELEFTATGFTESAPITFDVVLLEQYCECLFFTTTEYPEYPEFTWDGGGSSTTETSGGGSTREPKKSSQDKQSPGVIAGIVIGVTLLCVIVVMVIYLVLSSRRHVRRPPASASAPIVSMVTEQTTTDKEHQGYSLETGKVEEEHYYTIAVDDSTATGASNHQQIPSSTSKEHKSASGSGEHKSASSSGIDKSACGSVIDKPNSMYNGPHNIKASEEGWADNIAYASIEDEGRHDDSITSGVIPSRNNGAGASTIANSPQDVPSKEGWIDNVIYSTTVEEEEGNSADDVGWVDNVVYAFANDDNLEANNVRVEGGFIEVTSVTNEKIQ